MLTGTRETVWLLYKIVMSIPEILTGTRETAP